MTSQDQSWHGLVSSGEQVIESKDERIPHDTITKKKRWKRRTREIPWVSVISVFTMNVLLGIFYFAFSFFYIEFVETFSVDHSTAGWIGSLQFFISFITGIFFRAPIDKYGCRMVTFIGSFLVCSGFLCCSFAPNLYIIFITYGIITGLGLAALYMVVAVVSQEQFHVYRTFLTLFVFSGYALGFFVCPVLITKLVQVYTWRGAVLIISAIEGQLFVIGMLLPKKIIKEKEQEDHDCVRYVQTVVKETFDFSLLRNVPFTLYNIATFLLRVNMISFMVNVPGWLVNNNMTKQDAASLVMVQGGTMLLATPVIGIISEHKKVENFPIHIFGCVLSVICTIVLPCWPSRVGTITAFVIYALHVECWNHIIPVIIVDLVGVKNIGPGYAINSVFFSFSTLLSPPFSGWLFDITHDYNIPFYVNGGLGFLSLILHIVTYIMMVRKKVPEKFSQKTDSSLT